MKNRDDPWEEALEQAELDQIEQHSTALYDMVCDYMDEEELDEAFISRLLFGIALQMRMLSYGMEVEKPSSAGLKMEIDRCWRELEGLFRSSKKGAEEFISHVRKVRAGKEPAEGEGGGET